MLTSHPVERGKKKSADDQSLFLYVFFFLLLFFFLGPPSHLVVLIELVQYLSPLLRREIHNRRDNFGQMLGAKRTMMSGAPHRKNKIK